MELVSGMQYKSIHQGRHPKNACLSANFPTLVAFLSRGSLAGNVVPGFHARVKRQSVVHLVLCNLNLRGVSTKSYTMFHVLLQKSFKNSFPVIMN